MAKEKRNRRGEGTIIRLAKNKYRVMIDFGIGPDGKRDRPSKVVNGPRSEAVRILGKIKKQRDAGLKIAGGKLPFSEFADKWLKMRRDGVFKPKAKRTIEQSEAIVKLLKEYFGGYRLNEITAEVVDSTLAKMQNERKVSGTTKRGYYTQLNLILGQAARYGYIMRNPCADAAKPTNEKTTKKALGIEEMRHVLTLIGKEWDERKDALEAMEHRRDERNATGDRTQLVGLCRFGVLVALRLELCNGLRGEEAFALSWGGVDLDAGTISITSALDVDSTLKGTKNESSERTLYLDAGTASMLKEWKALQASLLGKIGVPQKDTTPLACSNTGGILNGHNARKYCREFLRGNEIDATPHELRHSYVTAMVSDGVDIRTMMELGGYASPDVLLGTYAHVMEDKKQDAARRMGSILEGPTGEPEKEPDETPQDAAKPAIRVMFKAS